MIGYVIRRIRETVIVMLIVSLVVFLLLHALPGGLVRSQVGLRATPFAVHHLELVEGLNKPLPVQFGVWLWNAFHGNLGYSYKLNQSVGSLLAEYVPRTVLLVGLSLIISIIVAVPLGMLQAKRRNRIDDHLASTAMLVFYAAPVFLLGVALIIVFNLWLNAVPATASDFGSSFTVDARDLVLPVLTLAIGNVSYFSRYMRSQTIDSLLEDYVRTARAKGASAGRVLRRHVLRNSLSSTVTMVGLSLPVVVSGALVIEELFNYPGVGLLFFNASEDRDFPVLLGVVLVVTLATVVGNLFADLGYALLDPRVRYK